MKCDEKTHPKVDEAVVALRRSLAEAEEKSITIVTVGFLTNIRSSLYFVHNMRVFVDLMEHQNKIRPM